MLREAMATLTPQCRRLVELLFFEIPSRPYTEVAAELASPSAPSDYTPENASNGCADNSRNWVLSDAGNPQEKFDGCAVRRARAVNDRSRPAASSLYGTKALIRKETVEQLAQLVVQRVRVSTQASPPLGRDRRAHRQNACGGKTFCRLVCAQWPTRSTPQGITARPLRTISKLSKLYEIVWQLERSSADSEQFHSADDPGRRVRPGVFRPRSAPARYLSA